MPDAAPAPAAAGDPPAAPAAAGDPPAAPAAPAAGDPPAAPAAPAAGDPPAAPAAGDPPAETWFSNPSDTWREDIAGEDEGKLNQLKRFTDPGKMFDSYFEGQKVISARNDAAATNVVPGADDPENVWNTYREANGIPTEAKGYGDALSAGLEIGDEDREALTPFFEIMHKSNLSSETGSSLVDAYYDMQAQETEAIENQDSVDAAKATQLMKQNWGGDFEPNKNLITGMLTSHLPSDVLEEFMSARLANGQALFNHPGVMQAFADMARQLNPAASIIPSGDNPMKSMEGRIAELNVLMEDSKKWHKSPELKKEYMQLIDAKNQMDRQATGQAVSQ